MIYQFDDCELDDARFELTRGGIPVRVEPQVFDLLLYLIQNRERLVSRDELLNVIWKGRIVSEATISSRIRMARRMIGDDGATQGLIRTLHGRGFRFVGKVHVPTRAGTRRQALKIAS